MTPSSRMMLLTVLLTISAINLVVVRSHIQVGSLLMLMGHGPSEPDVIFACCATMPQP